MDQSWVSIHNHTHFYKKSPPTYNDILSFIISIHNIGINMYLHSLIATDMLIVVLTMAGDGMRTLGVVGGTPMSMTCSLSNPPEK